MTEPFFHARAAEIIAAYGADPARWPDAERATAVAVVAASADLRAAQATAVTLDADLAAWANAAVAPGDAAAAAASALPKSRSYLRWGGTGIAAAVAAGLLLFMPAKRIAPVTAPAQTAAAPVTAAEATAFAEVFTPTPNEEQSL